MEITFFIRIESAVVFSCTKKTSFLYQDLDAVAAFTKFTRRFYFIEGSAECGLKNDYNHENRNNVSNTRNRKAFNG